MTTVNRVLPWVLDAEPTLRAQRPSLLVASDQPDLLSQLAAVAAEEFDVETAAGAGAALQTLAARPFDLILADQTLRTLSGMQLLAWARQHCPRTVRLLLVGPADVKEVGEALGQGEIYACALHPFRAEALLPLLLSAARQSRRALTQAPVLEDLWRLCLELQYTLLEQGRRMERAAEALVRGTSELEEDNRRLRRDSFERESQALIDPLTGLLNRRAIEGIAEYEVRRLARYPAPLAVGVLDADSFKTINTQHKLPGGDQALLGIARALSGSLRAADRLGRIGGDEFLLVSPQTDTAGARQLAERLRTAVEQTPVNYNGRAITVTVSIGFAVAEAGTAAEFKVLCDLAAAALNEAKAAGRNRAAVRTLGAAAALDRSA